MPLAVRLVRERAEVRRLLAARAAELAAAGHPPQVVSEAGSLPLFALVDGERLLLREREGGLELKGRDGERFDAEDVVARFESGAWLPSFSALSRPLSASTLYPVAATVLGPAELAYWAQMLPLFDWAGIVPPVLVARPMAAPVNASERRALEKLGLGLGDLFAGTDALLAARGAAREGALLDDLAAIRDTALAALADLAPRLVGGGGRPRQAARIDAREPPLRLDKLLERTRAAAGRANEAEARQLRRLAAALAPGGRPAERVYGPLPWLLPPRTRRSRRPAEGAAPLGRGGPAGDRAVNDRETVEILAVGAHPDDVELGCGGTLALLSRRGRSVGILDLTRGEAGTRGTPETRAAEAAESARILGALFRDGLDLGDGNLRTDRAAELEVIDVIRRRRPRLVFAPLAVDRHPDHVRASRLVTDAAFYAGLRTLETGRAPHRPQQVVYYPSTFLAEPTFLVDVTEVLQIKLAAVRAFKSQFFDPASTEPATFISSPEFLDGVTARARAFGRLANAGAAEGFVSPRPPLLADPLAAFDGFETGY